MRRWREKRLKREKPDQSLGSGVRPARERLCRRRSPSFFFLFVSFCFICAVPPRSFCLSSGAATNRHWWLGGWSNEVIDWRLRVTWSGLHVQVLAPGDGGYSRSVVVGFFSGGGGLLRSTVADSSSGKGRLTQLRLRRLLVTESGGSQSSALPSLVSLVCFGFFLLVRFLGCVGCYACFRGGVCV